MQHYNDTISIENSDIHTEAKVLDYSTIIHSILENGCVIGKFSKMAYSKLGLYSYTGDYTIVINSTIGKFTSISWGVTIGPEEHDYTKVTNHSFLYSLKTFQLVDQKFYSPFIKPCKIGNDVWIGCNATILRGVTIGDGAVIAANALVNRDVPPFAIVAGIPAKVIKFRFSDEIIIGMLQTQWWNLPLEVIKEHSALFADNPNQQTIDQLIKLKLKYGNG